MTRKRFGSQRAGPHIAQESGLLRRLLGNEGDDSVDHQPRDDNDAVVVRDQDVTWVNGNSADRDRKRMAYYLESSVDVLRCRPPCEDGEPQLADLDDIAHPT